MASHMAADKHPFYQSLKQPRADPSQGTSRTTSEELGFCILIGFQLLIVLKSKKIISTRLAPNY